METIQRDCVIAGGGPAGMMLGYLLARQGLSVSVLEKHEDFLRDFRGDTIHPSTITILGELGLRERFLALPLNHITTMDAVVDGRRLTLVDFATLPQPDNFLVFAPQWDFLNFIASEGSSLPGFDLRMSTAASGLITDGDDIVGLRAIGPAGELEFRAPLTIAADGRASVIRDAAGLVPDELGVPIDVLWFTLPKPTPPPPVTLGYLGPRGLVLTIERGDYYQGGLVIRKGGFDDLRAQGIDALRREITGISPVLAEVVSSLTDWEQVKLLSVQLNRLPQWFRPGFMCIGDAAHAMSPVGGVGINYAIQDAVALSNAIGASLATGTAPTVLLEAVQRRRSAPVVKMQRIQRLAHSLISRPTGDGRTRAVPRAARALLTLAAPLLRRIMARLVGRGFLPEHVADR